VTAAPYTLGRCSALIVNPACTDVEPNTLTRSGEVDDCDLVVNPACVGALVLITLVLSSEGDELGLAVSAACVGALVPSV